MINFTKNNIVKIIAVILSISLLWQGVVYANPDAFSKHTLQPQTLFTGLDEKDGFLALATGYLFRYLIELEKDIDNHNVFSIRRDIETAIEELRKSDNIPASYQEQLPTIGGTPEEGDVIINTGVFKVRYYNHRVIGAEDPGPSYQVTREKRIGTYLSRQILIQKALPEGSSPQDGEGAAEPAVTTETGEEDVHKEEPLKDDEKPGVEKRSIIRKILSFQKKFFVGTLKIPETIYENLIAPVLEERKFIGIPLLTLLVSSKLFFITLLVSRMAFVLSHLLSEKAKAEELTPFTVFKLLFIPTLISIAVLGMVLNMPVGISISWVIGFGLIAKAAGVHILSNAVLQPLLCRVSGIDFGKGVIDKGRPGQVLIDEYGALEILGLTYEEFRKLPKAQVAYEEELLNTDVAIRSHIFSLRTQERFSKTLIQVVKDLKESGVRDPLSLGLRFVLKHYYRDLKPVNLSAEETKEWDDRERRYFPMITEEEPPEGLPPYFILEDSAEARVRRAFYGFFSILFSESPKGDQKLMQVMGEVAGGGDIHLSVAYGHPFTTERQLVGHKVPVEGEEMLEFGYGALMKAIRNAEESGDKRHVLLIKNIEAIDPEVRTQLQEALRIGELEHPELGTVQLPENLQIIFTIREAANLEDDSFYDRVVSKAIETQEDFTSPEVRQVPPNVNDRNYLSAIGIEHRDGSNFLVLPGTEIRLSEEFSGIDGENLHDFIYERTGLVLDFDTVRMLVALENAVQQRLGILRIEGPTGVGKTFTARGYACLRGSTFLSNPVSQGTEQTDFIGGYEQDEKRRFRFNGQTSFKERAEEGGIIALSELNTLLDQNERVSLAWWLEQILEMKPDKDGYKVIPLTEVPVGPGKEGYTIRIHPETLIVVDTNPEGYEARGMFPEVFKENTAVISVEEFISGDKAREVNEKERIRRYADMFLKHDWVLSGDRKISGISGSNRRRRIAKDIADIYYRVVCGYVHKEFGDREKIVFTLRELKRITEDVLWGLGSGKRVKDALAAAISHHLVARWEDSSDREQVKDLVEDEFSIALPDVSVEEFIQDEAIEKNRPTHIRVTPQTDIRSVFRSFEDEHPEAQVKYMPITKETDRFMLEGGPIMAEDGTTQIFGHGILGRLIEEAEANPDKEIVYALENIHNLRAEEAVALNEFLQEGRLYLKGKDTKLSRPSNAHIVVVSRTDSDWECSEAEKSRYVNFGCDGVSRFKEKMEEGLSRALGTRRLPEDIRKILISEMLVLYNRYINEVSGMSGRFNRQSQTAFLKIAEHLNREIQSYPAGKLDMEKICEIVKGVLDEQLFKSFSPDERARFQSQLLYKFRLLSKGLKWAEKDVEQLEKGDETWVDELAMAKVRFDQAGTDEEREPHLRDIRNILEEHDTEIDRVKVEQTALNHLEISQAHFVEQVFKPEEGVYIYSVQFSPDGKNILMGNNDGKVRLYEYDRDERKCELKETFSLDTNGIVGTVQFSPDGGKIFLGAESGESRLYVRNSTGEYKPFQTFDHSADSAHFSFNSRMILMASGNQVVVYGSRNEGEQYFPVQILEEDDFKEAFEFIPRIIEDDRGIYSARFSPDGRFILIAGTLGQVHIYQYSGESGKYEPAQMINEQADKVMTVRFSRDGRRILTGSWAGIACLYEYNEGRGEYERKQFFGNDHYIWREGVDFSPDPEGNSILIGHEGGKANLYEFDKEKGEYALKQVLKHDHGVQSIQFSPDGNTILAVEQGSISFYGAHPFIVKDDEKAYEISTGREFSRDTVPGKVEMLDTDKAMQEPVSEEAEAEERETPEEKAPESERSILLDQILDGEEGAVNAIQFSPDNKFVLTGRVDNEARLYEYKEGEGYVLIQTLDDHKGPVLSVQFSPDHPECPYSKSILTGSADKKARLYVFKNGKYVLKQEFDHAGGVNAVRFSSDGRGILTGSDDKKARLYVFSGDKKGYVLKQEFPHDDAVTSVEFTPDGNGIITGSTDNRTRHFDVHAYIIKDDTEAYDIETSQKFPRDILPEKTEMIDVESIDIPWSHRLSSAIEEFNQAGTDEEKRPHLDEMRKILEEHGKEIERRKIDQASLNPLEIAQTYFTDHLLEYKNFISSLQLSPDKRGIIVRTTEDRTSDVRDRKLYMYMYEEGEGYVLKKTLDGSDPEHHIWGARFSPDSKRVFLCREGGGAILYRYDEKKRELEEEQVFNDHEDNIVTAEFFPDGRRIITGGKDKKACLYVYDDEKKKFVLKQQLRDQDEWVWDVTFSQDSRRFITGGGVACHKAWLYVYDDDRGEYKLFQQFELDESLESEDFSSDGRSVIIGSGNKVYLYEYDEEGIYKERQVIVNSEEDLSLALFSPDKRFIVTGGRDHKLRIYAYDEHQREYRLKQEFTHKNWVYRLQFSQDGRMLLARSMYNDACIYLYDEKLDEYVQDQYLDREGPAGCPLHDAQLSLDGKSILLGGVDEKVRLLSIHSFLIKDNEEACDITTGSSLSREDLPKRVEILKTETTGPPWTQVLAEKKAEFESAGTDEERASAIEGIQEILEKHGGEIEKVEVESTSLDHLKIAQAMLLRQIFDEHEGRVNAVRFSSDGRKILTGSSDGIARLYAYDDVEREFGLEQEFRHAGPVNAVRFSQDGWSFLTGSDDKKVRLFTRPNEREGYTEEKIFMHDEEVISVRFTQDLRGILAGGRNNRVRVFDIYHEISGEAEPGEEKKPEIPEKPVPSEPIEIGEVVLIHRIFEEHEGEVRFVELSPDSKYIFAGSTDNRTHLYERVREKTYALKERLDTLVQFSLEGGRIIRWSAGEEEPFYVRYKEGVVIMEQTFDKHYGGILSATFSQDGKSLLIGNADQKARLYVYNKEERIYELKQVFKRVGRVTSAGFSSDGNSIFIGSEDKKARLYVFDERKEKYTERQVFRNAYGVESVCFSPDGSKILTGSKDSKARLYEYNDIDERYVLGQDFDHEGPVNSVGFSADGDSILTGSGDGKARLFVRAEGAKEYVPCMEFDHEGPVVSVQFTLDGNSIFTGSKDNKARLFFIEPSLVKAVKEGQEVKPGPSPAAKPDKKEARPAWQDTLAMARVELSQAKTDKERELWLEQIQRILEEHGEEINKVEIAHSSLNDLAIAEACLPDQVDEHESSISAIQFSPDGSYLIKGTDDGQLLVYIRNAGTGEYILDDRIESAEGKYDRVITSVRFFSDGQRFIAGCQDREARIYRLNRSSRRFNKEQTLKGERYNAFWEIWSVDVSKDASKIILGCRDNRWRLFTYDKSSGEYEFKQRIEVPTDADRPFTKVRFSPDPEGTRLFTSNGDGITRIYEFDKKEGMYNQKDTIEEEPDGGISSLAAFSADCSRIATAGWTGLMRIYMHNEDEDKYELKQIIVHQQVSWSIEFSPDGRSILAGYDDRSAILYVYDEKEDKYEVKQIFEFDSIVKAVQFTPDGKNIIVASGGTPMHLHSPDGQRMVGVQREREYTKKTTLYSIHPFIAMDSKEAYDLKTSERFSRDILLGKVDMFDIEGEEAVEEEEEVELPDAEKEKPAPKKEEPVKRVSLKRREGKPFYFAADTSGNVYLNFKGNWFTTRHTLVEPEAEFRTRETVIIDGSKKDLFKIEFKDIRNPYEKRVKPLTEHDFLMDTDVLEEVESSMLNAFRFARHIDLEGSSGAGKTSIAKEMALLLGLPRFVFQMHGERELSDLIGSYREDDEGKIRLSNRPFPVFKQDLEDALSPGHIKKLVDTGILVPEDEKGQKFRWRPSIYTNIDLENALKDKMPGLSPEDTKEITGLLHYRQPLLEFLTHGGVFVADEGAIGEQGRDLLSWFSAILSNDEVIHLEEFPGHELSIKVHPDFCFIITNNLPENTFARETLRSEISSNLHFIYVDEDESEDTLKRLFCYFLGEDTGIDEDQKARMAAMLADFHWKIKVRIGKDLGKENKDRYHISKREIRRIAGQMRTHLLENPGSDGLYTFYKACRIVYQAGFSHRHEHEEVLKMLHDLIEETWKETPGLSEKLHEELNAEIQSRFGASATNHEAWVAWVTDEMFRQDEPVLYISEYGARTKDMLGYAANTRNADIQMIDAAPEHTELEILGGLLPYFGKRKPGQKRSRFARGRITQYLVKEDEMEELSRANTGQKEIVVWIRNIDQWNEDIRTALNGLLEEEYIDLETDEGRIERFYKPEHVHFVSEVSAEVVQDFSSAFFNRWIKIGVSSEHPYTEGEEDISKFERVLRNVHELDKREAFCLKMIYELTQEYDTEHRWADRGSYNIGSEVFYMIAEAIEEAKQESAAWKALLEEIARTGYDPRRSYGREPSGDREKELFERYNDISRGILLEETIRILGARFSKEKFYTGISDWERFTAILGIVFDVPDTLQVDTSLVTEDGTYETLIKKVGIVPLNGTDKAVPRLKVSSKHRLRYTDEIRKGLSVFARAESLSRGVVLVGESGSAKTTLAGHYAEITGKKFYKYQCHAGSEYTDLTMDVIQQEDRELKKRVKELYRMLREGNVVIDIDEANISPRILWVLEPIIRGESMVYPIFPEEEPFEIGKGVVLVFTMNPERYAARKEIDRRLTDRMITCRMELPTKEDKEKIVESFYGVWMVDEEVPPRALEPEEERVIGAPQPEEEIAGPVQPGEPGDVGAVKPGEGEKIDITKPTEEEGAEAPKPGEEEEIEAPKPGEEEEVEAPKPGEEEEAEAPEPGEEEIGTIQYGAETEIDPSLVPEEGEISQPLREGSDRMMRRGMETFDYEMDEEETVPETVQPEEKAEKPFAYGIFDPELYPYTRYCAYDKFDEGREEWIRTGTPEELIPIPRFSEARIEREIRSIKRTHDVFTGRYRVKLNNKWHLIPAAGADMKFLDVAIFDKTGQRVEVNLELGRDSADNYYIRAPGISDSVDIVVVYRIAVTAQYFGCPVPRNIPFTYRESIPAEVREAMDVMGLTGEERDYREVLHGMVEFFRDFSLDENGIRDTGSSLYLDIIHSKCGVCRHRAYAFARTALGIGMPVRYVKSDTHAYGEVNVPGMGWIRTDLGGGGDPMNMDLSPLAHDQHVPRNRDGLPEPETFQKDGEEFAKRMKKAMEKQGIEPQTKKRRPEERYDEGEEVSDDEEREARETDTQRIREKMEDMHRELEKDVQLHDEISELFTKGEGDTEFIFDRMLRAMRSRLRIIKKRMKKGLEVDPVAVMLGKDKPFIHRKRQPRMQTAAASVLLDFSESMAKIKEDLAFIVGAVGKNFWKLRENSPKYFNYDLSFFTDDPPETIIPMGERLSEKENRKRLVYMANQAGKKGTNITQAMEQKLTNEKGTGFLDSREARSAKRKYMVLVTDGADFEAIRGSAGEFRLTPAFSGVLRKYREAEIDVIVIGLGEAAKQVAAFKNPGQHYIRIAENRPFDIAEAIAKIAEHKSRGTGILPDGDITDFLQIGPIEGSETVEEPQAATILLLKKVFFRRMPFGEYAVRVAPWLESAIFKATPFFAFSMLMIAGITGFWGFLAGIAGFHLAFILLHVGNIERTSPDAVEIRQRLLDAFRIPFKIAPLTLGVSSIAGGALYLMMHAGLSYLVTIPAAALLTQAIFILSNIIHEKVNRKEFAGDEETLSEPADKRPAGEMVRATETHQPGGEKIHGGKVIPTSPHEALTRNAEKTVDNLVHALTGATEKDEKVVLALDTELGEGEINSLIKKLINILPGIEGNNEYLERFLSNLVICKGEGRDLARRIDNITDRERGSVKPENVIIIAKRSHMDYFKSVEGRATIAGVDDEGFNETAYLPLLEIMLFAVSKHMGWEHLLEERYKMIPNVISAEDLNPDDCRALFSGDETTFVIRLIPDAEPFDKEGLRDLMDEIKLILSRA